MQCFEVGDKVIVLMRPFLSLVLHMCENIEQIMHYSWNNCLIYKKNKDFLYTEKHGALCDINSGWPIVHFKFWHQKGDVFFFNTCMYLLFAHYIYYVYIPMTREKSNFEWKLLFVYLLKLQLFVNKYVFYYNFF